MPPFAVPTTNTTIPAFSPTISPAAPPSATANPWSPDAIATIVFGLIMFFIGVAALWQGSKRLRHVDRDIVQDEESQTTSLRDVTNGNAGEECTGESATGRVGGREIDYVIEMRDVDSAATFGNKARVNTDETVVGSGVGQKEVNEWGEDGGED